MRQRVTYLLRDPQNFEISQLNVKASTLHVKGLIAAKEQRLTLAIEELPAEVVQLLAQCQEVHIRWTSSAPYEATTPFISRLAPGLHVSLSPRKDHWPTRLCPILKKIFTERLKCDKPEDSFTAVPTLSGRFANSASSQFYQHVPDLKALVTYVQEKVCRRNPSTHNECAISVAPILSASYIDIDYNAISQSLTLSAFWSSATSVEGWTEELTPRGTSDVVEVGVLNEEKSSDQAELSLGGFLTVLGADLKPKATLFSFPARHMPLPKEAEITFSATLKQPTGLHPVLQLSFPVQGFAPPRDDCYLHAYLTLPSYFFLDRYQLQDQLFLASNNLKELHTVSGATDLEAPDYVIPQWGSASLLELAPPELDTVVRKERENKADETWTASVPLHLRYLSPNTNHSGVANVQLPWPAVFWACPAEEGTKFSVNPFDRSNLGYDSLFGPRTAFYHVPPARMSSTHTTLVQEVQVPVLDLSRSQYVQWGTATAVATGTAWLCWKVFTVAFSGDKRAVKKPQVK